MKLSVFAAGVVAVLLSVSSGAHAQSCRSSSATNLLGCAHVMLEDCRQTEGCPKDLRQALSVQDVLEAAARRCCPLSGRRERDCINSYANSLRRTSDRAPSALRSFLSEARRKVLELRSNRCSTGTLGRI